MCSMASHIRVNSQPIEILAEQCFLISHTISSSHQLELGSTRLTYSVYICINSNIYRRLYITHIKKTCISKVVRISLSNMYHHTEKEKVSQSDQSELSCTFTWCGSSSWSTNNPTHTNQPAGSVLFSAVNFYDADII